MEYMKHSNFEEEMREIFELLEECSLFDKKMFDLKEDELVTELERLKYKYFKKGFLTRMLLEEK